MKWLFNCNSKLRLFIFLIFLSPISFAETPDLSVVWIPRNTDSVTLTNESSKEEPFKKYIDDLKKFLPEDLKLKVDIVKIRLLDEDEPQNFYGNAICNFDKKEIKVARLKWLTSNENTKQQLVDHEMGHCAFGMVHHSWKGLMNPTSFSYENDKDYVRSALLDKTKHDKINELIKLTKNVTDLKEINKIEDSLNGKD